MNTFYISPSGSDSFDGSLAHRRGRNGPMKTIHAVITRVREMRSSGAVNGTVRIELAKGVYPVLQTLELGPEDSFLTIAGSAEGETIIDGGEKLKGFSEVKLGSRRAWVIDLPDVRTGHWYFRSLFVGGKRMPRARWPKFSPDPVGVKNCLRMGEIRFPEKRSLFAGDNWFKPKEGDFKKWPSLPDAEIAVLHYWTESRLPMPVFDEESGWVRCARRTGMNLYESWKPEYARYYIDNLQEALTEPGEWYLDRVSGRLTYLPLPGQKLDKTEIHAPRVVRLVRARGIEFNESSRPVDAYGSTPIEQVHLEGVTFRHVDWMTPLSQFLRHDRQDLDDVPLAGSGQAAWETTAAVEFASAKNCSVERCKFHSVGAYGLDFSYGSRHCNALKNVFHSLGAGGIRVWGGDLDQHPVRRSGHIRVEDNDIREIGLVFHQGVGILLGAVFDCSVVHNHISEARYTGISVGWSWGYRDTVCRNNLISNNRICNIGMGVLSDMGGIYTLGVQPGTVVCGNHISNVRSHHYGGWGIYPDEGSSHIVFEQNLVHDTQGSPFRMHFARELVLRNNVFVGSKEEGLIGLGRVENHCSATLIRNLLIGPAPYLYEGGYAGDLFTPLPLKSDSNLIWFPGGEISPCAHPEYNKDARPRLDFEGWRKLGNDRLSIVADPQFSGQKAGDFRLKKNSPASRIGFEPFDWASCGPRA